MELGMARASFHFPRGFLWGTATSAHQVEGNNTNNNWYAWEQEPGKILEGHKSGLACDWWNGRWRDDLDRMAEGGQNTHRFSVEWSRIQPTPDRWDESAIDRYIDILRGMYERRITPLVTLHHFSDPLWLVEKGGWENDETPVLFEKFTAKVVDSLKEYVSYWCTINEPNVYAIMGYGLGVFPPGKKNQKTAQHVLYNMVRGHALAYHTIHRLQPTARAGFSLNYRGLTPARSWLLLDRWVTAVQADFVNNIFPRTLVTGKFQSIMGSKPVPEAKGTQDYFGLNYYTLNQVSFSLLKAGELFGRQRFRPGAELSHTGFLANEPEGFFDAIRWALQFKMPILITENGIDDPEDKLRPKYLAQHIHQMWRAVNFNYPVKGYFHWTQVDNFEWERGWTQRYGLWELNNETQVRRKRASADFYAEICRENGLSSEMVAHYIPEIVPLMFPD
jgi:beta-glucosidase